MDPVATELESTIDLPWGEAGLLPLALPPAWRSEAEVVQPDVGGAIGDYPEALARVLDAPGGTYWAKLIAFMREEMLLHGMISPEDLDLFRRTRALLGF